MINKKSYNESLQREEDRYDGEPLDRNIIERARAVGINPSAILEDIINAIRNVDSSIQMVYVQIRRRTKKNPN